VHSLDCFPSFQKRARLLDQLNDGRQVLPVFQHRFVATEHSPETAKPPHSAGRRRELSYFHAALPCSLDGSVTVNADPPSEYRLVFIDPAGSNYADSPEVFGVFLEHWRP
jgi:hypothetical protein